MKYAIAPRVTGEICLALVLYCFFIPAGATIWLFAAFAAAVLVCGIVASFLQKAAFRLLCCLPAALLLIAVSSSRLDVLIVMAVCWIYAAVRFTVGKYGIRYWVYRREFAVIAIASFVASILLASGLGHPGGVGFAAAAVLSGIFSLRLLRRGDTKNAGWSAYNAMNLLLPLGIGAGLSALAGLFFFGIYNFLKWLPTLWQKSEYYFPPADVSYVMQGAGTDYVYGHVALDTGSGEYEATISNSSSEAGEWTEKAGGIPPYVWGIIAAVALILILVIVVVIVRRRNRMLIAGENEKDGEKREDVRGRRGRKGEVTPEKRIRAAYTEYLRYLERNGQTIRPGDTSQDVLTASPATGEKDSEEELRELYIAARYGSGKPVGASDADRAEELLRKITGEK